MAELLELPFPHDGRTRHGPPAQYGTTGRKAAEQLSLEDGIAYLFDSVSETIEYCSQFQEEFHQDIYRISSYCEKRLLEAVWMQKVRPVDKASRDRQRNARYDDSGNHGGADYEPPTFRNIMRQLLSALTAALTAAEDFRPSQRRPSRYSVDDATKIRQQLHRSYQNLRKSFTVVMERRSEMESVNTELEMLRVFLSRNGADQGRQEDGKDYSQGRSGYQPPVGSDFQSQDVYEESGEQEGEWPNVQEDGQGKTMRLGLCVSADFSAGEASTDNTW
ncbi:MAG: hypothetical protein Q9225_001061 [Loekoesia sp. 1 TL-2023]